MKKTVSFLIIGILSMHLVVAQVWQTYLVAATSANCTGLALDIQKRPHVFYYSPNNFSQNLNHAWWNGETWISEVIGSCAIIHNDGPSAAFDSFGNIHVAYFNDDFHLAYAVYDGEWQIETVDSDEDTGDWCSIRIDSADVPHIAYSQTDNYTSRYAIKVNGTWQLHNFPGAGAYGINMVLDEQGLPHISDSQSGAGIRYSHHNGSEWFYETGVAPGAQYNSLTLDTLSRPQITYYYADGAGNFDLFIATKNSGTWQQHLVDHGVQQSKRGWDNHLITTPNGLIHCIYLAHNEMKIRHAWGHDDQWQSEEVDNVGMYDSGIEVTKDGNNLYTSYYDENTQQVRISTLAGDFAPCENLVGNMLNNDLTLTWNHPGTLSLVRPTQFRIYQNQVLIGEVSYGTFELTVENLEPGPYNFWVTAVFSQQFESEPSNIVTIFSQGTVTIPEFSPEPGIYQDSVEVEIFCPTPETTIHYTLDGSIPTEDSPVYTEPIFMDTTTTIKARAYRPEWQPSDIAIGMFEIENTTQVDMLQTDYSVTLNIKPNPASEIFHFEIVQSGNEFVELSIFDAVGTRVICLIKTRLPEGKHICTWDATNHSGQKAGAGTYFCVLKNNENKTITKKLILLPSY